MPAPLAAPLIAAGASLLGTGASAFAQGKMNKKTREWNEKMYGQQRQDALADWDRQNAYNSPQAQMARLKEAGLNPNLVYDNGAAHSADAVRSSSAPNWSPEAPTYDLGSAANAGISTYYDTQMKQKQMDQLQVQTELAEMEKLIKAQDIIIKERSATGLDWDNKNKEFNFGLESELRAITVAARQAALNKTLADTKFTLDSNERARLMTAQTLEKGIQEIIALKYANSLPVKEKMLAEIENLKKDGAIKDFEISLNKMGLTKGDPGYIRAVAGFISTLEDGTKGLKVLGANKKESTFKHEWFKQGVKAGARQFGINW